ncbi:MULTISPECIES: Uma2 family endonuclease [Pseudanabaena]|uniref:Uma2 family endonuclease n=1 Tax=Pseudanabaena TaxID=1152 RepID=UPI002479D453|nr:MULTISPECIES: Uma2 family endonuclease [Pseudanabaena]MEA5487754.1 Uma2 family endonuclease [Pseudanabaena sp. CCNP1317]WGS72508.1 Uma2 family endonuclease [Pseudanabaena galeata CCNP1313]
MTSASVPQAVITLEPKNLKRWTVQDYHRISELGLLIDERTELIAGQITIMAAKGTPHVTSLHLLANVLRDRLGTSALVRTQDPIHLDDFSEPEPDLAIAQGTVLDYVEQHPSPEQIYLVVEVADSTLKQDCEIKDKLYAKAGIADYWVLAPQKRQLHIFRKPTPTGYTEHLILTEPSQASLLAFPDFAIALTSILPPIS